jgi:hypothetical protein
VRGATRDDLLAVDPVTHDKYHIESSISAARGFSLLTGKPFELGDPKFHRAKGGRTLAYFRDRKFDADEVTSRLTASGKGSTRRSSCSTVHRIQKKS